MSHSENRKRKRVIPLRLSDDEYAVLDHMAKEENRTHQDVMRRLILVHATMEILKATPASAYVLTQEAPEWTI